MSATMLLIATALSEDPSLGELLEFVGQGLLVVVLALASLAFTSWATGRVLHRLAPPVAPAPAADASQHAVPDEVLAAITAAVATVVGQPHRVVHVRGLTTEDMNWALEGRLQIHSSHTLKPRTQQ